MTACDTVSRWVRGRSPPGICTAPNDRISAASPTALRVESPDVSCCRRSDDRRRSRARRTARDPLHLGPQALSVLASDVPLGGGPDDHDAPRPGGRRPLRADDSRNRTIRGADGSRNGGSIGRADGSTLRAYNLHLSPHEDAASRRAEAVRLTELVAEHGDHTDDVIVGGDFNDDRDAERDLRAPRHRAHHTAAHQPRRRSDEVARPRAAARPARRTCR